MTSGSRTCSLGAVIAELGPDARLWGGAERHLTRTVEGSSIWSAGAASDPRPSTVLVCPRVESAEALRELFGGLPGSPSRVLVLALPAPGLEQKLADLAGDHAVVLVDPSVDQAEIVRAISRATDSPDETISRRLSALQRSLTQVLNDPEPVPALLNKVKSLCNATVALVDKHGRTVHATGPLPMNLLMAEITSTQAASQTVQIEGWRGLADRITDPTQAGEHFGWLVVTARRPDFPDAYSSAAIHVATTLVEASHRMTYVAALQERAIRAAVLEEAIALDRRPQAPQLAGQVASFGLSFRDELRIAVAQPVQATRTGNATTPLEERLRRLLSREGIPHLISARERYATVLLQCTPATLRRLLVAEASNLPDVLVGVGRGVREIADIANSFHDAQLAVRALSRARSERRFMSYDEFDFATRLFSDVGLDSMLAWAEEFLTPLDREGPLFESLQVYFEQNQNINAAAELLHVHHNSLRYRLTKVEELLKVSLRDPAAVASVFLALAAVDLGTMQSAKRSAAPATTKRRPADIEAPGTPAEIAGRPSAHHGVVLPPEH
jgi:hypothetical protein